MKVDRTIYAWALDASREDGTAEDLWPDGREDQNETFSSYPRNCLR